MWVHLTNRKTKTRLDSSGDTKVAFDEFPRSALTVVSPEGKVRARVEGIVTKSLVMVDDPKATILSGDEIRRTLPNGQEEVFSVIDPVYCEDGPDDLGPHYQVSIQRKGVFAPTSGGHYAVNVSGPNSRVNISSHDQSVNIVHEGAVFDDLKKALARGIADEMERDKLLRLAEELSAQTKRPGFGEAYQRFIAASANHMTIITPFIPLLAAFFR
jgi:hypothetical protein